jgi:hypothetical protein
LSQLCKVCSTTPISRATSAGRRPAAINCTAATLNSSVYLAFAIRFIHHLRYRHILLYRRYPKIAGKLSREFDDAEGWAWGFVQGVDLCRADWQPLLETDQGRAWYRPIGLLGEDDFGPEQDALTRTPAQRAELALQIPAAVLGMHAHWIPLRLAIHERAVARTLQAKVGRNEPCPCGSGKKFKKCCGAPADLH